MVLSKFLISAVLLIPAALAVKTRGELQTMSYGDVKRYAGKIGLPVKFGNKKDFIDRILEKESAAGSSGNTVRVRLHKGSSSRAPTGRSSERTSSSMAPALRALLEKDDKKSKSLRDDIGFERSREQGLRAKVNAMNDRLSVREKMNIAGAKLIKRDTKAKTMRESAVKEKAEKNRLLPLQTEFHAAVADHIKRNNLWSTNMDFWYVMGDKNCLMWKGGSKSDRFVIPRKVLEHPLWNGLADRPKNYRDLFNSTQKKKALLNESLKQRLELLLYNNQPKPTDNMDTVAYNKLLEKYKGLKGLAFWNAVKAHPTFPISKKDEVQRHRREYMTPQQMIAEAFNKDF